jgi:glycosyltransferase involved in cell wall biosynthesis
MRLLFVIPFYKPAYVYGGPVRSVSSLCEALVAMGHDVTVLTTNANGPDVARVPLETDVDVDGVRVRYFPEQRVAGGFFYSPSLRNACSRAVSTADLAYIYGVWNYPAIAAGAACRRAGVPYVVSPRTSLMHWAMQHSRLRKQAYLALFGRRYLNGARAIHYTSESERTEAEVLGLSPHAFVVPNPVNFSEFDNLPPRGRFRAELGLPADVPIVLYIGRLEPRKGLEVTLRSFAVCRGRIPSARLVIAGPARPGYDTRLSQLADELGIAAAVHLPGYVDAKRRLEALVDADLFVLTSYAENFGVAAVEAMATGTATVLSDQVGVAQDLAGTGACEVVPLDVDAIGLRLATLIDDSTRRATLSRTGRAVVRERYRPEAIARQMAPELERLTSKNPSPRVPGEQSH